jgi:hypothetical protein
VIQGQKLRLADLFYAFLSISFRHEYRPYHGLCKTYSPATALIHAGRETNWPQSRVESDIISLTPNPSALQDQTGLRV